MPFRALSANTRRTHERWLMELTSLPTASGREDRVIAWIARWVAARRNLVLTRDRAGNLLVRQAVRPTSRGTSARVRPGVVPIRALIHISAARRPS